MNNTNKFFLGVILFSGIIAHAYPDGERTKPILCESWDHKHAVCPINELEYRDVVLVSQLSKNSGCIRGYTWGVDNGSIWVDGGCRANFAVILGRPELPLSPPPILEPRPWPVRPLPPLPPPPVIVIQPLPPMQPNQPLPPPAPQPPYNQPPYNNYPPYSPGYSLGGYCADYDHAQFYAAKQFANSSSGLNYYDSDAVNWALRYNQTHACGTINEFVSRFRIINSYASSSNGLNMYYTDARDYALSLVETTTTLMAQENQRSIIAFKSFATRQLNKYDSDAGNLARQWVQRNCGSAEQVEAIRLQFVNEYSFASSSRGLNMYDSDARAYAAQRVRNMTVCSDLIY